VQFSNPALGNAAALPAIVDEMMTESVGLARLAQASRHEKRKCHKRMLRMRYGNGNKIWGD
jgi:hypothetical protein